MTAEPGADPAPPDREAPCLLASESTPVSPPGGSSPLPARPAPAPHAELSAGAFALPTLISPEPGAFAPAPRPVIPAPAEGAVRAAADVRGVAAPPPSRGVAQVGAARPRHAAAALPPLVFRAVASVPGALSVPGEPPADRPITLAPPGGRRAFAIRLPGELDGWADPPAGTADGQPPGGRFIGRAAVVRRQSGHRATPFDFQVGPRPGDPVVPPPGVHGREPGDRAVGALDAEGPRPGEEAAAGAVVDGQRGLAGGEPVGLGSGERPAAGALVELRRPGAPVEVDGSAGRQRSGGVGVEPARVGAGGCGQPVGGGGAVDERGAADGAGLVARPTAPPEEEQGRAAIGRPGGTVGTGGYGADSVRKRRLRQVALPPVAAGVAALAVGAGYLATVDRTSVSDLGRWGVPATAAPVTVSGRGAGDPFGAAATVPAGAPSRLRVTAIGLDTSLETLRLGPGDALVPPHGYGQAGWYVDGTAPGDVGPAVIAGHVDSKSGPAVFYRLRELTVGDRIEVVRGGLVVAFTVTRVAWYPKVRFPTGEVYGPTPDRQLRLITCGGVFDHRLRSYTDNLVVYAVAG